MSTTDADDPSTAEKAVRTVTPPYVGRPNREMTTIGIVYFLTLLVLLVPLLPFIVLLWLVSKVIDAVRGRATG